MHRLFKKILLPFSALYDAATHTRNHSFDIGWRDVEDFHIPIISVGNLSVGGTGKTPHVEYLIRMLKDRYKIGVLSRGYGRKTRGVRMADEHASALTIGDEPMQYWMKFGKEVRVAVGEKRALATTEMLRHWTDLQLLLLDDAYQHRMIHRDFNILLTEYNRPFFEDYILPAGRLRERRAGAKRADLVIVTKCPTSLTYEQKEDISNAVGAYTRSEVPVIFSSIVYSGWVPLYHGNDLPEEIQKNVILVSGIANTRPLIEDLRAMGYRIIEHIEYYDHFHYDVTAVNKIKDTYEQFKKRNPVVLTTEKDAVKLQNPTYKSILEDIPMYYQPIQVRFSKGDEKILQNALQQCIREKL
ncbi:tetraacyldisaccharide 4'-kinase [Algivirga pacifica]|uniref:Tetraacyldisaccharide 4'-kinase n=1 Tax=Algivirga pacifica TaxID=1162670 RepID=A0ABP9DFF4_9BACT